MRITALGTDARFCGGRTMHAGIELGNGDKFMFDFGFSKRTSQH